MCFIMFSVNFYSILYTKWLKGNFEVFGGKVPFNRTHISSSTVVRWLSSLKNNSSLHAMVFLEYKEQHENETKIKYSLRYTETNRRLRTDNSASSGRHLHNQKFDAQNGHVFFHLVFQKEDKTMHKNHSHYISRVDFATFAYVSTLFCKQVQLNQWVFS